MLASEETCRPKMRLTDPALAPEPQHTR
jgi:hypothetical protein